jgi:hypothetical protein
VHGNYSHRVFSAQVVKRAAIEIKGVMPCFLQDVESKANPLPRSVGPAQEIIKIFRDKILAQGHGCESIATTVVSQILSLVFLAFLALRNK